MRSIAIVALLALLIMPCIAVTDSVTTGPYKISFDLGMPKEAYTVEVTSPKTSESLSGVVSTDYVVTMTNKTANEVGLGNRVTLLLNSYEGDHTVYDQNDLVQAVKYLISGLDYTYDIQAAERKIDNSYGSIASGKSRANIVTTDAYVAKYYPSSTTDMTIFSTYPWDEGTLSLLKTIHVEKINATT